MNLENSELYVKIAGFVLKLMFKVRGKVDARAKKYILSYFGPFILQKKVGKVDYSIELLERDGVREIKRKQSIKIKNDIFIKLCSEDKKKKKITAFFPIVLYDLELILRLIFFNLLKKHHSFCVHSGAALLNKKTAYLFLGESGAGKSTVLKLLKRDMMPIYDDIGFIKKEKNTYSLYAAPYREKNQYKKNNSRFIIDKIFIIKKSLHFGIEKVSDTDLSLLIKTIASHILVNKDRRDILDFIAKHGGDFYYLYFSHKDNNLAKKLLAYAF